MVTIVKDKNTVYPELSVTDKDTDGGIVCMTRFPRRAGARAEENLTVKYFVQ